MVDLFVLVSSIAAVVARPRHAGGAGGWPGCPVCGGVVGFRGYEGAVGFGWGCPLALPAHRAGARVLVLFVATLMDALVFERLAGAFDVSIHPVARRAVHPGGPERGPGGRDLLLRGPPPARGAAEALLRIYEDLRGLQGRLAIIQWVIVGLLAMLTVNFWQLQVLRGKYYRNLAENNRIRPVPIPAPRGLLFDRNGGVLVDNRHLQRRAQHRADRQPGLEHQTSASCARWMPRPSREALPEEGPAVSRVG